MRGKRKWAYRAGLGLLWLIVALLALEVFAAARWKSIVAHNPLIQASLNNTALPISDAPLPEVDVDRRALERLSVLHDAPAPVDSLRIEEDANLLQVAITEPGALMSHLAVFDQLEAREKELVALLAQEFVLELNSEGKIVASYGERSFTTTIAFLTQTWAGALVRATLLRGFFHELESAAALAAKEVAIREVELPVPDGVQQVSIAAAPDSKTVYAVIDGGLARWDSAEGEIVPEESRWEIPQFRYKPNRSWDGGIFTTNSFGYRDEEFGVPKPEGVFRLLCLGGSTTEEGNSNEVTYPNLLEQRLRAALKTDAIEVFNCGISSIGTGGHVAKLAEYLSFEPDLVIIYAGINDIVHIQAELSLASFFRDQLGRSRFLRQYWPEVLLADEQTLRENLQGSTMTHFAALQTAFARHGAPVVFCSIAYPEPEALSDEEVAWYNFNLRAAWHTKRLTLHGYIEQIRLLNEMIRSYCKKNDLYYIPIAEHFNAGAEIFGDICHMNPAGTERKAEVVYRYLQPFIQNRISAAAE